MATQQSSPLHACCQYCQLSLWLLQMEKLHTSLGCHCCNWNSACSSFSCYSDTCTVNSWDYTSSWLLGLFKYFKARMFWLRTTASACLWQIFCTCWSTFETELLECRMSWFEWENSDARRLCAPHGFAPSEAPQIRVCSVFLFMGKAWPVHGNSCIFRTWLAASFWKYATNATILPMLFKSWPN